MRKRNEYGPLHPDFGKFDGDGLVAPGEPKNEEEMKLLIERLRDDVQTYIIMQDVTEVENNNLHNMLQEQARKNEELTTDITKQQLRIEEMEKAFASIKQGRETELEEIRLIYFDKEKTLLKKYKSLQHMFDDYKKDITREFGLKEQISQRLALEKEQILKEIDIAKMILSDKNLCQVAHQRFKDTIDTVHREKLL